MNLNQARIFEDRVKQSYQITDTRSSMVHFYEKFETNDIIKAYEKPF